MAKSIIITLTLVFSLNQGIWGSACEHCLKPQKTETHKCHHAAKDENSRQKNNEQKSISGYIHHVLISLGPSRKQNHHCNSMDSCYLKGEMDKKPVFENNIEQPIGQPVQAVFYLTAKTLYKEIKNTYSLFNENGPPIYIIKSSFII